MARTKITTFTAGLNTAVEVTPVAIDTTNDMYFEYDRDDLTLIVYNSSEADDLTMTIKAVGSQDDLAVVVGEGKTFSVANLESARFKQANGTVNVDFSAGATGTIFAVKDPV